MADNKMWTPTLDDSHDTPLYVQLLERMEQDIQSGVLSEGDKLPPQRQLAWALKVNLSTVSKAFQMAKERQLIATEIGRGTYIMSKAHSITLFNLKQDKGDLMIDLSTHKPAIDPNDHDLQNCLSSFLDSESILFDALQYHCAEDIIRLQIKSSQWLERHGYSIEPQYCVNLPSAQNALMIALLASCKKDDTVLVNEYIFPGMKAAAKQLSLRLHPVKMDNNGIIPDSLEQAVRVTGSKVLVSDTLMQNPTACSMDSQRQEELKSIIKNNNLLFIEEYVIGILSGTAPISCSIKDNSILITSFSKAIAPGLRFAVIAGKHPVINTIQEQPHSTNWQLSPLTTEIACRWIDDGTAQKRTQWQQQEIFRRYTLFKKLFPESRYEGNRDICSHIWLAVKSNSKDAELACREHGVEVVSSDTFAVGRQEKHYIRVSLTAAKSIHQLKQGLLRILKSKQLETSTG